MFLFPCKLRLFTDDNTYSACEVMDVISFVVSMSKFALRLDTGCEVNSTRLFKNRIWLTQKELANLTVFVAAYGEVKRVDSPLNFMFSGMVVDDF